MAKETTKYLRRSNELAVDFSQQCKMLLNIVAIKLGIRRNG